MNKSKTINNKSDIMNTNNIEIDAYMLFLDNNKIFKDQYIISIFYIRHKNIIAGFILDKTDNLIFTKQSSGIYSFRMKLSAFMKKYILNKSNVYKYNEKTPKEFAKIAKSIGGKISELGTLSWFTNRIQLLHAKYIKFTDEIQSMQNKFKDIDSKIVFTEYEIPTKISSKKSHDIEIKYGSYIIFLNDTETTIISIIFFIYDNKVFSGMFDAKGHDYIGKMNLNVFTEEVMKKYILDNSHAYKYNEKTPKEFVKIANTLGNKISKIGKLKWFTQRINFMKGQIDNTKKKSKTDLLGMF